MTNEEKVIQFLNEKFQQSTNNIVAINAVDLPTIGLSEKETIQALYLLEGDNLLKFVQKSPDDDFSMFWRVALKSSCVHYFDNKKTISTNNRRAWVQTYAPIAFSVIATIISIIALVVR